LNSAWIPLATVHIGDGNPAGGTGSTDPVNAGLFSGSVAAVNTTGFSADATLYYWVYNAPTAAAATQQGLFSSTTWTFPSGNGGGTDTSTLDTDLNYLTAGGAGSSFNSSTGLIPIGSVGLGTNVTGGGMDFQLVAIPEPAETVVIAAVGALALALYRRRLGQREKLKA
jgi:hypothetical protein